MRCFSYPLRLNAVLFITLTVALFVVPADVNANQPDDQLVVVIRTHRKVFEGLLNRSIQKTVPFQVCVIDAWCVGTADATATVKLDYDGGTDDEIRVLFEGTINAPGTGYKGRIIAAARATLPFQGRVALGFDGSRFSSLSGSVRSYACAAVDHVRTKRGGIGKRIVNRIGVKIAPRIAPKYCEAGARMAEHEILERADTMLDSVVSDLNQLMEIDDVAIKHGAKQGYERVISKSDRYVQARIAPIGMTDPVPPEDHGLAEAPMEIWIYPNSERPLLAEIALFLERLPPQIRELIRLPESIEEIDKQTQLDEVGDWDVIRVGSFDQVSVLKSVLEPSN